MNTVLASMKHPRITSKLSQAIDILCLSADEQPEQSEVAELSRIVVSDGVVADESAPDVAAPEMAVPAAEKTVQQPDAREEVVHADAAQSESSIQPFETQAQPTMMSRILSIIVARVRKLLWLQPQNHIMSTVQMLALLSSKTVQFNLRSIASRICHACR